MWYEVKRGPPSLIPATILFTYKYRSQTFWRRKQYFRGVKWPKTTLCFLSAMIGNCTVCQHNMRLSDCCRVTWRHDNREESGSRRSKVSRAKCESSGVCMDMSIPWWNERKLATTERGIDPTPTLVSRSSIFGAICPPQVFSQLCILLIWKHRTGRDRSRPKPNFLIFSFFILLLHLSGLLFYFFKNFLRAKGFVFQISKSTNLMTFLCRKYLTITKTIRQISHMV